MTQLPLFREPTQRVTAELHSRLSDGAVETVLSFPCICGPLWTPTCPDHGPSTAWDAAVAAATATEEATA